MTIGSWTSGSWVMGLLAAGALLGCGDDTAGGGGSGTTSGGGGDGTGGVIPYKNPKALLAYYIGLFAILPVFGLGMGPAALILGIQGLKYAQQYPVVKGQVHAWIGIVLGALWTLVHFGLLIVTIAGFVLARSH